MLLSILRGLYMKKPEIVLNERALKAKEGDEEVMNDLLFAYTPFMKKTASFVCKRFIDEHDDEFSIAMNGFHEAVQKFDSDENSSLTTFAHLVIKRRLVDYLRKETMRKNTVFLLKETADEQTATVEQHHLFDETSIELYSQERQAAERREEIKGYNKLLVEYGLSFEELSRSSPKHADSRKTAFHIAQIIAETPEFHEYVLKKKRLPVKELEELVEVSRKTIERHRKYIIAVVLLLSSNFVYIKEYIKGEVI